MCSLRIRRLTTLFPVLSASARHCEFVLHGAVVHADAFAGQVLGTSLHDGEATWPAVGEQLSAVLAVLAVLPAMVAVEPEPDGVDVLEGEPPLELLEQPPSSEQAAHAATVPRRAQRRPTRRVAALVTSAPPSERIDASTGPCA
jgi:hypothetical protein